MSIEVNICRHFLKITYLEHKHSADPRNFPEGGMLYMNVILHQCCKQFSANIQMIYRKVIVTCTHTPQYKYEDLHVYGNSS